MKHGMHGILLTRGLMIDELILLGRLFLMIDHREYCLKF